ncbi:MAG: tRNA 2-selenouridine(34) synthase MnmH [Bacteroidetes bacterium]|nr:tRNA 2-selenouridine(34) synthase MnmH [Bacteroidota bacterium]
MAARLPIPTLPKELKEYALIDVRSEAEFERGHIPGAVNIPILRNEERVAIGTAYKQQGRDAAVTLGYEMVGPRFAQLYVKYKIAIQGRKPLFYCWRGGLRSQIASTLLHWGGYHVHVGIGGYKAYRHNVQAAFARPLPFLRLGGLTGSGKTEVLQLLQKRGEQILDLEQLAHHKGSALGSLGLPPQPSVEMFENLIHTALQKLDHTRRIWVENESRKIGTCVLHPDLWNHLCESPLVELETPTEIRIQRLVQEYGHFPKTELQERTARLRKKLGGQHEQAAQLALEQNRMEDWVKKLLVYYDSTYSYGKESLPVPLPSVAFDWNNPGASIDRLLSLADTIRLYAPAGILD